MISHRVKFIVAMCGVGVVLVGSAIGAWILLSSSNATPKENKADNIDLAALAKSAVTSEGNKPQTRGNVPLFQVPWKQDSDDLTLRIDSLPATNNESDVATVSAATPATLPFGQNTLKSQSKPATTLFPTGGATDKAAAATKLPFGDSSASKKAASVQLGAGSGATANLAPKNEVVRGKALIPILQDNATQDPKTLLTHYFQQVCGDRNPGLSDWQTLAKSRPQELKQYLDLPFGDGHFITSLCQDIYGRVWVGTEGEGVWCWDPNQDAAKQWRHFTRKNTGGPDEPYGATSDAGPWLGDDNAYALACDKLGRIWVGHLNHGVSVFNGEKWQNYGVIEGPIGERIFAMATSPVDGDVWIATSAGLTRYSLSKDDWSYYTRAEGLPSDQANALAFAKDGTLYVGTQCDGIAIAKLSDDYASWRTVRGAESLPLTSQGTGLPTNLINDVLVAQDGTVYAATTTGLAFSKDQGNTWTFIRGKDWIAKAKGLFRSSFAEPMTDDSLLMEDNITCLTQEASDNLWLGTRLMGCQIFLKKANDSLSSVQVRQSSNHEYVNKILTLTSGRMLIGRFGEGIYEVSQGSPYRTAAINRTQEVSSMPSFALPRRGYVSAAGLEDLREIRPRSVEPCCVIPLVDDWSTQGNWLRRYGTTWALLCGMGATDDATNYNLNWVYNPQKSNIHCAIQIGRNSDPSDGLRHWMGQVISSSIRSLEIPEEFRGRVRGVIDKYPARRQSEIDDHGEAYSRALDGPNLYMRLSIPSGLHRISLYFINDDGHNISECRQRDYAISISTAEAETFKHPSRINPDESERLNVRVGMFWHGIYKRALVCGPACVSISIKRNYSFNTILSGIFVDEIPHRAADVIPPDFVNPEIASANTIIGKSLRTYWIKPDQWSTIFNSSYEYPDSITHFVQILDRIQEFNTEWFFRSSRVYWLDILRQSASNYALAPSHNRKVQAAYNAALASWRTDNFQLQERYMEIYGIESRRNAEIPKPSKPYGNQKR